MLTDEECDAFETRGIVQLRGAVGSLAARAMSDQIWAFLDARQGIRRDDEASWSVSRPSGLGPLARAGVFDAMWSPAVEKVLVELFSGWPVRRERGRVLLTFPEPRIRWDVPRDGWHFDFTALQAAPGLRSVQVFVLLSPIRHRGGGTLVLSGSHHLVSRYVDRTGREPRPNLVRSALAADPELAALWGPTAGVDEDRVSRFLDQRMAVDGVDLSVVEVTGQPGDVYLMNSDCFHAIATNGLDTPRLMLTSVITRADPT